jgi:hypothetical protein
MYYFYYYSIIPFIKYSQIGIIILFIYLILLFIVNLKNIFKLYFYSYSFIILYKSFILGSSYIILTIYIHYNIILISFLL